MRCDFNYYFIFLIYPNDGWRESSTIKFDLDARRDGCTYDPASFIVHVEWQIQHVDGTAIGDTELYAPICGAPYTFFNVSYMSGNTVLLGQTREDFLKNFILMRLCGKC